MTSMKEIVAPRKKGPVTWEALTRWVMADWRVVVREDCLAGLVDGVVRRRSKGGMILRLIWNATISRVLVRRGSPEKLLRGQPTSENEPSAADHQAGGENDPY